MPERVAAPLRQQIVALLSEAIAASEFAPGARLIERDLCARFEVSRTVIREALRQLESQGLVEIVPNRGPVVARVSAQEAAWLYEVRAALEGLAAEAFAKRATAEERAHLVAAVDNVEKFNDASDLPGLLGSKDDFYEVLFEGAHNPIIASLLKTLHARIQLMRGLSLSTAGRGERTTSELRGIVAAVTAGDGAKASRLARRHVENAAQVALRRLAEREADRDQAGKP
jgi:DNA-binding GntR family transcriptional regulator